MSKLLINKLASENCLKKAWDNLEKRPYSHGFDDITIAQFKDNLSNYISETVSLLGSGKYSFYPLRLYLKDKGGGDYRQIKIPTIRDRVVQRAVANLIAPYLEKKYNLDNDISFAYVRHKSIEKAAIRILKLREEGYRYVCKADIIKFFDNIDRKILIGKIEAALPDKSLVPLIKAALDNDIANTDYYEQKTGESYVPNSLAGVAQGCPLSPLFANVFLADFDKVLKAKGYKVVRYADDFVIMTKSRDEAKNGFYLAKKELEKIKLSLYELKDDITVELWKKNAKYSHVRSCQQLEFLGLRFESGKVYPAGSAYKNAMKSIRLLAYDNRVGFAKKLEGINARIQGWCSSYSFTELEGKKIASVDTSLEDVLTRMLKHHSLAKTSRQSTANILGLKTFGQVTNKVRAKINKH